MKSSILILCTVFLLAGLAAGQTRTAPRTGSTSSTMSVQLPMPAPVEFEIKDQPGSPLHLTFDKRAGSRLLLPGSPITVRNDGASTIDGFVLRVDVEPYGMNKMVIVGQKGLGIGQTLMQGMGVSRYDDPTKPTVSVDYVHFADGQTWGEDSLRKSKDVIAYLQGRKLALQRFQQLIAGQDDTDFKKTFDVFGSASFGEPNLIPTGRPPRQIDYSARGYEEIINLLRRMPRNTVLAKDLARQLEVMAQTPGQ